MADLMLLPQAGGERKRIGKGENEMAERKLFAGHAIRRLRFEIGVTQAAMAEALEISASYLNLVERNQRPVSAALMLKLAETYDFDPRRPPRPSPAAGPRRCGDGWPIRCSPTSPSIATS